MREWVPCILQEDSVSRRKSPGGPSTAARPREEGQELTADSPSLEIAGDLDKNVPWQLQRKRP